MCYITRLTNKWTGSWQIELHATKSIYFISTDFLKHNKLPQIAKFDNMITITYNVQFLNYISDCSRWSDHQDAVTFSVNVWQGW